MQLDQFRLGRISCGEFIRDELSQVAIAFTRTTLLLSLPKESRFSLPTLNILVSHVFEAQI